MCAVDGWAAAVDSLDSPSAADRPIARRRGAIIRRRTSIIRRRTSIIRRRTSIIRRRTSLARRRRTSIIREALLEGAHRLRRFRAALARLCARLMDRRPACRIPHVARFDALGSSVLRVHGEYLQERHGGTGRDRPGTTWRSSREAWKRSGARRTRLCRQRATCNAQHTPVQRPTHVGFLRVRGTKMVVGGENAAAPPGRLPGRRTRTRTHGTPTGVLEG